MSEHEYWQGYHQARGASRFQGEQAVKGCFLTCGLLVVGAVVLLLCSGVLGVAINQGVKPASSDVRR